jgi:folylpolyglutamate synthase/dihydropteroate synthase
MLNNKDALGFLSVLKKNINTLYPFQIPNEKNALTKNQINIISKELKINSIVKNTLRGINQSIMKMPSRYILITGSLYLIGKIKKKYL